MTCTTTKTMCLTMLSKMCSFEMSGAAQSDTQRSELCRARQSLPPSLADVHPGANDVHSAASTSSCHVSHSSHSSAGSLPTSSRVLLIEAPDGGIVTHRTLPLGPGTPETCRTSTTWLGSPRKCRRIQEIPSLVLWRSGHDS